jgi:spore coat protein YsxE
VCSLKQSWQRYVPVLRTYHLHVDYIEENGKVKKVYTNKGTFALKELHSFEQWQAIEQAYRLRLPMVPPIYEAMPNQPLVRFREQFYYLMPWLKKPKETNAHFFRDLATWHKHSIKERTVTAEEIQRYYDERKNESNKEKQFLNDYMEKCEQQWYMSPFQLQFCTYFHEVMRAYLFSEQMLERWHEVLTEKKKIRVAFIHGNPSFDHYVEGQNGARYFISMEHAKWAAPFHDLFLFFHSYLRTYPFMCDDGVRWMNDYEQELPLSEDEQALFYSYLAYPHMLYRLVYEYEHHRSHHTERQYVARLQKAYWQIKNIEYVISKWMEAKQKQP